MTLREAQFLRCLNIAEEKVLENVRANLARHTPRLKQKRAVFIGGAPSIADHIEEIREKQREGFDIFAMNGSANFLLKHGIAPDYHVLMDAREGNEAFVSQPSAAIKYYVASQCHPAVFDALAGFDVTMWHAAGPDGIADIVHEADGRSALVCGGGTVGTRSMYIAYMLGYCDMALYGYDGSNRGTSKHAYEQAMNAGQPIHKFTFNGVEYEASGPMASQAEEFPAIAQKLIDLGVSITLRCEGLLPAIWAHHQTMQSASLEDRESYKYTKMWGIPEYREDETRLPLVDTAIATIGVTSGRVVDYGCGSGLALQKFQSLGFDVLGVDITHRCMNQEIAIPLCIAPLWDLPEGVKGDLGYCTDVLEHIPPEKLDDVIKNILRATHRAFFQICFVQDHFGSHIGMPLHLSVHPNTWWLNKFGQLGFCVEWSQESDITGLYYVRHWLLDYHKEAA